MVPSPSASRILQLYFTLNYFFILSALLIYSFTKKKKLRQFPLHKSLLLETREYVFIIDFCTSFYKARYKMVPFRTIKKGFENCSPYLATHPQKHNLAQLYYTHRED